MSERDHDYVFSFSDIGDALCSAQFMNCRTGDATNIQVTIDDRELLFLKRGRLPSVMADAADLALAVYVADRLSASRDGKRCKIHISLPVRNPSTLSRSQIVDQIEELLYAYTHNVWTFTFVSRKRYGRLSERQPVLMNSLAMQEATEVALWSGGLDALAGLYSRITGPEPAARYTLFGTGGNSYIHHVQRDVADAIRGIRTKTPQPTIEVAQVRLRMAGTDHLPKNSTPRARGFVFLLLGAVCAVSENQNVLYIYENGVGAINLPFRQSEVGLDHSQAVHPTLIRRMGRLITALQGEPFVIRNPFEFVTKAQMCSNLARDGVIAPIHKSVSCDRRHRAIPMQCGRCSSCLLRRQALAVNGIKEPMSRYVVTAYIARGKPIQDADRDHLRAMLAQVADLELAFRSDTIWRTLVMRFTDLADVAEEIAQQDDIPLTEVQLHLMRLYTRYITEWKNVRQVVGQGILPDGEL